jgi:hypothetical protein
MGSMVHVPSMSSANDKIDKEIFFDVVFVTQISLFSPTYLSACFSIQWSCPFCDTYKHICGCHWERSHCITDKLALCGRYDALQEFKGK